MVFLLPDLKILPAKKYDSSQPFGNEPRAVSWLVIGSLTIRPFISLNDGLIESDRVKVEIV